MLAEVLYKTPPDPYNRIMRFNCIPRTVWSPVLGVLMILTATVCPVFSAEETIGLPGGIWVGTRIETDSNAVVIEVGATRIEVDRGRPVDTRPGPRYRIETGAVVPLIGVSSATELRPRSRGESPSSAASTIVFDSGFTVTAAGREAVFHDLGRNVTASDAVIWLPVERILITGALCSRARVEATPATDLSAWVETLEVLRDLEPALVIPGNGAPGGPELIEAQIDRVTALGRSIEDALLEGSSAQDIISGMNEAWFIAWREEDPQAANAALSAVINEIGGLTTPWELIEDRRLREGESPARDDDGWTAPEKVLWRNRWPERLPLLDQVAPGVEIIPFDTTDEAMESVADVDAVIGAATPELLAAGENLRWVQVGSAGVERYLKIPELGDGSVLLTNGQRLASEVIGEHAMAMTRALARGLNRAVEAQVEGQWRRSEIGDNAPLTKLRGKTLLVVGLGGIGTEVARLADAAGMRVTAIRSSRRSGPSFVASVGLTEDLASFIADADVVVNCLPMTPDTEDVFSAEQFSLMKKTAFFINVGRGGTVDTEALEAALNDGKIAGAGLDVTDPEPLPDGHPLWNAPNLIITPHFAAWSDAGRELHWLLFRENLRRFVAGKPLLSVVDPERGY